MKDSIEERMLAYRTKESQFAKGADVATTRSSSMSSSAQAGNSSDFICQRLKATYPLSDLKKERINDAKLFFMWSAGGGTGLVVTVGSINNNIYY